MSFAKFAQEKDAASFRDAFLEKIQAAVADEIEQQKIAVAQSMFGNAEEEQAEVEEEPEAVAEEVEQMDEVSPPGREKQVKALKKTGVKNPWAVAWASYNKSKK